MPKPLFSGSLAAAACAAALLFGLAGRAFAADAVPSGFTLEIVHVNDMHGAAAGIDGRGAPADDDRHSVGGFARAAAFIKAEKAGRPHVLALDAGDRWQGSLFFRTGGPDFLARACAGIPFDASTLGNHEFDLGVEALARYIDRSAEPFLAANLRPEAGSPLAGLSAEKLRPWRILEMDGVKVGVFGLANTEAPSFAASSAGVGFLSAQEAARRAVLALERAGAAVVVALTHQGYAADLELARRVEGIDVVVGGHTHSLLGRGLPGAEGPYPTPVAHADGSVTLVVQAKRSAEYVGRLTVGFSAEGEVRAWTGAPVRLAPSMPRDAAVEREVEAAAQAVRAFRAERIGTNESRMPDGLDPCRAGECLSGLLAADAFLEFARPFGAEIALVNGGAIRAPLPVGPIDRGTLLEMHPFGNRLALISLTGREIRAALEHGLAEPGVVGPHLLQPAGLRYAVRPEAPVGRRVLRVEVRGMRSGRVVWTPIEPEARYRVATLEYLARGGDGFPGFARAPRLPCPPCSKARDVEVFEAHIRAHDPVPMPERGRIEGMPPANF